MHRLHYNLKTVLNITNEDNMDLMSRYEDKYFELAIVDPPYGIGDFMQKSGNISSRVVNGMKEYKNDKPPEDSFFIELQRVSKEQIIWGANYYNLGFTGLKGSIIWDKMIRNPKFSEAEIASTTTHKRVRIIKTNYKCFD